MGLLRRLSEAAENCNKICYLKNCSPDCTHDCLVSCTSYPPGPLINIDGDDSGDKISKAHHKISTVLIITLTLLSFTFFVVCCYALYVKFRLSRRRRSQPQTEETQDEDFFDEEHGPVVDHPIWYIRTTGLQESVITAITICKYKKDEGLIEGTECSVCLSEFEEDETLRLLPKCSHAFHLPCIDTWLRSHTNCPMCRAPIVNNPSGTLSEEPNLVDSSSMENTQMEFVIDNGENSARIENSVSDLRIGGEEEAQLESEEDGRRVCESGSSSAEGENLQPRRRSVSLDDSTAAKVNRALATFFLAEGSSGNSSRQLGQVNGAIVSKRVSKGSSSFRTKYLQSVPTSMKRSRSLNGKHMLSWHSRSQKKPNPPIRSF